MHQKDPNSGSRITVYGTKEGKLYIKPEELFKQPTVISLINKIVNSKALKDANALEAKMTE